MVFFIHCYYTYFCLHYLSKGGNVQSVCCQLGIFFFFIQLYVSLCVFRDFLASGEACFLVKSQFYLDFAKTLSWYF